MAAMGIAKAHLVGHSLGGAISLDLALNHPERVASVTAVAPAALGPEISMEYIDGFIDTSRARKLKSVLEMLVFDPASSPTTWSRTCSSTNGWTASMPP